MQSILLDDLGQMHKWVFLLTCDLKREVSIATIKVFVIAESDKNAS